MGHFRAILFSRRDLALAFLVFALAMKLIMPSGFMFNTVGKQLTVTLCSGVSGQSTTITIPTGPDHQDHGDEQAAQKDICPYGALGHATLGGADPVLLAEAIAFLIALGFAAVALPALRRRAYVQPPLRGPPLTA
jgi:hypothetical protein